MAKDKGELAKGQKAFITRNNKNTLLKVLPWLSAPDNKLISHPGIDEAETHSTFKSGSITQTLLSPLFKINLAFPERSPNTANGFQGKVLPTLFANKTPHQLHHPPKERQDRFSAVSNKYIYSKNRLLLSFPHDVLSPPTKKSFTQ